MCGLTNLLAAKVPLKTFTARVESCHFGHSGCPDVADKLPHYIKWFEIASVGQHRHPTNNQHHQQSDYDIVSLYIFTTYQI